MRHSDNSEAIPTLRPLESADVTFLTDLWVAAWQETVPQIDFEVRRDWLVAFLRDPAHVTLVAACGTSLRGFVSLERDTLHQIVVAREVWGTGVGVRLLDAAKAAAPEGLSLEVNQANTRAIRFYAREGFVITAADRNPISGLATWRMRWTS